MRPRIQSPSRLWTPTGPRAAPIMGRVVCASVDWTSTRPDEAATLERMMRDRLTVTRPDDRYREALKFQSVLSRQTSHDPASSRSRQRLSDQTPAERGLD